ncbi:MAG: hypothetical protein JWO18_314 [Microbacteriaceae bacterium]|jgi:hypothetical protein|nr:hypothetical protein [Microbacteriaceae bacterium]
MWLKKRIWQFRKPASDVDQVMVSVVYSQNEERNKDLPVALAKMPRKDGGDGISRFLFPAVSIEEGDSYARENAFEAACLTQAAEALGAGISRRLLEETDGRVNVLITLRPDSGQAGIAITPEIVAAWEGVPVHFLVSSI